MHLKNRFRYCDRTSGSRNVYAEESGMLYVPRAHGRSYRNQLSRHDEHGVVCSGLPWPPTPAAMAVASFIRIGLACFRNEFLTSQITLPLTETYEHKASPNPLINPYGPIRLTRNTSLWASHATETIGVSASRYEPKWRNLVRPGQSSRFLVRGTSSTMQSTCQWWEF